MMKILVAGISVRAMTESAVKSGYRIIALDAFGDRDLRELTEAYSLHRDFHTVYSPAALCKAGRKIESDAVAYTSNLENYPEVLAHLSERRRVLGNPPDVLRTVRNWADLRSRLKSAGFPVPETVFSGERFAVGDGRCWLVKPVLSGGGNGVGFVDSGAQSISGEEGRFCRPGFVLQEYIPGKPCSAAFAANGRGCVVLGITEQLVGLRRFGSRGFRYCGNIIPLDEAADPGAGKVILRQVRRLAEFLTREYRLTGVNGIDFILKGSQLYLVEVNPRYSASMELVERAYGLPVFHLHVRAAMEGSLPDFNLEKILNDGRFFGKSILFAGRNAVIPDTGGWAGRGIRDIPETGEKIRGGGPVCTVLAEGGTRGDVFAGLVESSEKLKVEIYG